MRSNYKLVCEKCDIVSIVCQAFWRYTCDICGEEKMNPNTDVPKVCRECAEKNNVCMYCGEKLDEINN